MAIKHYNNNRYENNASNTLIKVLKKDSLSSKLAIKLQRLLSKYAIKQTGYQATTATKQIRYQANWLSSYNGY